MRSINSIDLLGVPEQGSSFVSNWTYSYLFPYKVGFRLGLTLPLCLVLEHLAATGPTFPQVVGHVKALEKACFDTFSGAS